MGRDRYRYRERERENQRAIIHSSIVFSRKFGSSNWFGRRAHGVRLDISPTEFRSRQSGFYQIISSIPHHDPSTHRTTMYVIKQYGNWRYRQYKYNQGKPWLCKEGIVTLNGPYRQHLSLHLFLQSGKNTVLDQTIPSPFRAGPTNSKRQLNILPYLLYILALASMCKIQMSGLSLFSLFLPLHSSV